MKESFKLDVEVFAGLLARLDHPFADRAAILSQADLTERSCEAIAAVWRARFAEPSSGELVERFAAAYAHARTALRSGQPTALPLPDASVLRATHAKGAAPGAAGPAETAELTTFVPTSALPFTSDPALPPRIAAKGEAPSPKRTSDTEPLDPSEVLAINPLPFRSPQEPVPLPSGPTSPPPAPPRAPETTLASGRWLIRFDPETGEPLREPYWTDEREGSERSAKAKRKK